MSMNRGNWLIIVVVAILVAAAGLSSLVLLGRAYDQSYPASQPGSYGAWQSRNGGMMGGWSYLGANQLGSIQVSQPVAAGNGTLTFSGSSIRILVLMGPMAEGQSMYSFVINNMTNPTLIIPRGAKVTMTVVNVDTDAYHGLTLTGATPPYTYNFMPMMMGSLASTGVLPPSSSEFPSQQISFTVSGEMYYVCPVPGHAQSGMYGLIRPG